jgi:hypothetical protein
MQFVTELNRELTAGQLAIWNGTADMPEAKRQAYIARWKGEDPRKIWSRSKALPMLCPSLGADTGETVGCRVCNKSQPEMVAVHSCAKHGKTTLHKAGTRKDVTCCKWCDDNPANIAVKAALEAKKGPAADSAYPGKYPTVGKRHLIYHLLPVKDRWQANVDELLNRWPTFTRKVVAIMTGGPFSRGKRQGDESAVWELDSPSMVRSYFPSDTEFIELPNDPKLREVVSWVPLVESIIAADPADAVLYAHSKGVTRSAPNDWTKWLYELALDYPGRVDSLLAQFPIVGSFKKSDTAFKGSKWHYHGTFFLFRVGDMMGRPWKKVPQEWWGVEGWPGTAYAASEGGVVFKEGGAELDLFKAECVDRVRAELAAWRAA